jgi:hypothetical protein
VVDNYSYLISAFANQAWFPHDGDLEIKVTQVLELSQRTSLLVQFTAHDPQNQDELLPCLVTALINRAPNQSDTFEFIPIHILGKAEAGFWEVRVFDTEAIMEDSVHSVTPAFDFFIDTHSRPLSAKVLVKFFVRYKKDNGQIATRFEMVLDIPYLLKDLNGPMWRPNFVSVPNLA